MASVSHLAVGALCGAVYARKTSTKPLPALVGFALLGLSPDLDFIAVQLGSEGTALDHRVLTHSLAFAVLAGVTVAALMASRPTRRAAGICVGLALASHGLLDAMTANGPGPELLWPFLPGAIQLPWHPIPGTDFYMDYFTAAAIPVFVVEALSCLPVIALTGWLLARPADDAPLHAGGPPGRALEHQVTASYE